MSRKVMPAYADVFRSELIDGAGFSENYQFPILDKSYHIPSRAIPFDAAMLTKDFKRWVHFYVDDYRFERLWSRYKQYLNRLKKFDGVIAPDFSIYRDMPVTMQIWNTYRNRALAYWLQKNGVNVIPNVRWGDERTYEFAFEGLKPGGTFAVSTNGCIQDKDDRECFKTGLAVMVERLQPRTIVNYSQTPDDIFGEYRENGIIVMEIEHFNVTVSKGKKGM